MGIAEVKMMLLQFVFKNYKSFRDEAVLDLTATKESGLSFHVRQIGNEKVLPVSMIYGANAAGKSNVQEALKYMVKMVLTSLNYGEESKNDRYRRPAPYVFSKNSVKDPSSFEVYFTVPGDDKCVVYNYGFTVDEDGIVEEWLNSKARTARKSKCVFYRNRKEIELDGLGSRERENLRIAVTGKTLLVSLGARLRIKKLRTVFLFFAGLEFADFGRPIENYILSRQVPPDFVHDETVRKDVIRYFSAFDESIVDLRVKVVDNDDTEESRLTIDAGHKIEGSDEIVYIPLKLESAGTLKMFALYPFVRDVLRRGGVLFVDELNARLHPLLVRTFVQLFVDPETNRNDAQLIFTSHDSWQLNNGAFRRDEIWFTEKDGNGASALYSLSDFISDDGRHVRGDENYERNYLLGKYGGIPTMNLFEVSYGADKNGKK